MEEVKTILVVDDTKANIDILLGLLNDYDVMVAMDGETAVQISSREKIDLILLDIIMPGQDGYQTCRILKNERKSRDIPVIFITSKTDESSIERAFEVGGVDYVTKPFLPGELLARVRTHLQLRSLINHLDYISSHDPMTKLYNRRKFFELATQMFNDIPHNLYGVIMDIDKFKNINDSHGHPVGDIVIREVARTMVHSAPDNAVIGRIGGEEFSLVFHASSGDEALSLIERIRKSVEALDIDAGQDIHLRTTLSCGLAAFDNEMKNLDQLLKKADDALYESKNSGRNKSIFRA